jgi:hypothetical protein
MSDPDKIGEPRVEVVGDDVAENWERLIEEAERDIRAARVSRRWLKPPVEVIKQAAATLGIPYQTYIKQTAVRQALVDLKAGEVAVLLTPNRR